MPKPYETHTTEALVQNKSYNITRIKTQKATE